MLVFVFVFVFACQLTWISTLHTVEIRFDSPPDFTATCEGACTLIWTSRNWCLEACSTSCFVQLSFFDLLICATRHITTRHFINSHFDLHLEFPRVWFRIRLDECWSDVLPDLPATSCTFSSVGYPKHKHKHKCTRGFQMQAARATGH